MTENDIALRQSNLLIHTTSLISNLIASRIIIAVGDIPAAAKTIYAGLASCQEAEAPAPVNLVPAVPINKSVFPDYIVCLEDGKKFKSLKRHLNTDFGLTPEAYREKWGLKSDYPMVAPGYSAKRSELAKASGLGRKPAAPAPAARKRA